MPSDPDRFADFPDEARVWLYAAERPLDAEDVRAIEDGLAPFLASWTSHRRAVRGACGVIRERFLAIVAWAPDGDLSGCGIDKSVHQVEAVGRGRGITWHSSLDVAWRSDDGSIRTAARSVFRRAVAQGDVTSATPVFDLSIESLSELREGRFERPAAESWHARVFGLHPSAS